MRMDKRVLWSTVKHCWTFKRMRTSDSLTKLGARSFTAVNNRAVFREVLLYLESRRLIKERERLKSSRKKRENLMGWSAELLKRLDPMCRW